MARRGTLFAQGSCTPRGNADCLDALMRFTFCQDWSRMRRFIVAVAIWGFCAGSPESVWSMDLATNLGCPSCSPDGQQFTKPPISEADALENVVVPLPRLSQAATDPSQVRPAQGSHQAEKSRSTRAHKPRPTQVRWLAIAAEELGLATPVH